ncbi:MAG: bifunctional diaminohydroxyphosphoribosylaminopyrimidine deaminase/5-amino-6-(5-phosphoribosylamino)uracil reductase RibD [Candidatus Polarisedimenticolaceae bacterium]|nr:bifunctional diaminohydroxyphosphoribosylaminopyrimidine deaminase/5-amino-6-(5-phosphoribosylamino)uracil reductase RibD [Candidatus Polarisedimenticolaceae bacterium]
MIRPEDYPFMAQAIKLARRGRFSCHPNPRVGALLVQNGIVVGEGFHQRAGEPHAEPIALSAAGGCARGATVYVTLEPCSHHGRTPPCADALIQAGVSRVVVAMEDPNPVVAGRGVERLRQAGIEVHVGLLESEAQRLNPGFIKRMRHGLPFVRCKLAMSLDGRTAMASGESKWITSDAARRDVHRLRALSSAVMTGVGTVIADDASLNVRLPAAALEGVGPDNLPSPQRLVLDSSLRMPLHSKMLSLPGETTILCLEGEPERQGALETAGAVVVTLPELRGRVDLRAAMRYLARQEINEILLEAGPQLAGSMLQAGLLDELVIYMAPHLMGDGAKGLFHLPDLLQMQDRIELEIADIRAVGGDWRITVTLSNCCSA